MDQWRPVTKVLNVLHLQYMGKVAQAVRRLATGWNRNSMDQWRPVIKVLNVLRLQYMGKVAKAVRRLATGWNRNSMDQWRPVTKVLNVLHLQYVGKVAQAARRLAMGWMAVVQSRMAEEYRFFHYFVSRLVLGSTQPPAKCIPV